MEFKWITENVNVMGISAWTLSKLPLFSDFEGNVKHFHWFVLLFDMSWTLSIFYSQAFSQHVQSELEKFPADVKDDVVIPVLCPFTSYVSKYHTSTSC